MAISAPDSSLRSESHEAAPKVPYSHWGGPIARIWRAGPRLSCQTKPIYRVSGLKMAVAMENEANRTQFAPHGAAQGVQGDPLSSFAPNKANLWRFWPENTSRAEKQSQSKPMGGRLGRGDAGGVSMALDSGQEPFDKAGGGCYNPRFVMDPDRGPLPHPWPGPAEANTSVSRKERPC